MKVLVVADSHSHINDFQQAINKIQPEVLIFLGDGLRDLEEINLPKKCVVHAVLGNNDKGETAPIWSVVEVLNHKFFITHGHTFFVPQGVFFIASQAKEKGCEFALFGHTHHQFDSVIDGVRCINPGCICGQFEINQTYVELDVSKEEVKVNFCRIE